MAVDANNMSQLENLWGSTTNIDANTISQFLSGGVGALVGGNASNLGAQNQDYAYAKLKSVQTAFDQQTATQEAALKAINPAFNIQNYINPSYQLYDPGQGEEANRTAPLVEAQLKMQAEQQALQAAQAAATKYQQTGVIDPFPDKKQMVMQALPQYAGKSVIGTLNGGSYNLDAQDSRVLNKVQSLISGAAISPETMQSANAAAASVGATLPYPSAGIGQTSQGSMFQSGSEAQNFYNQDGTINTTKYQQYAAGQPITSAMNASTGFNSPNGQPTTGQTGATNQTPGQPGTGAAETPIGPGSLPTSSNNTTGSTASGGVSTAANASDPAANAAAMNVLNGYLNDGTIDSSTYQFFKQAIAAWDPSQQVDYANILNTFETIKQSDIDPQFQQQADVFVKSLETNRDALLGQQAQAQQQNTDAAKQNVSAAQTNLAARGMTFTGQAVNQLGTQSAFATPGQNPNTPLTITPVGGTIQQGTVQQANTAAASSTNLRYQQSLQNLTNQAEATLGSTAAAGLVPGTTEIGGITGTLNEQKQSAEGTALSGLYNQRQQNVAAQQPQQVFSS